MQTRKGDVKVMFPEPPRRQVYYCCLMDLSEYHGRKSFHNEDGTCSTLAPSTDTVSIVTLHSQNERSRLLNRSSSCAYGCSPSDTCPINKKYLALGTKTITDRLKSSYSL